VRRPWAAASPSLSSNARNEADKWICAPTFAASGHALAHLLSQTPPLKTPRWKLFLLNLQLFLPLQAAFAELALSPVPSFNCSDLLASTTTSSLSLGGDKISFVNPVSALFTLALGIQLQDLTGCLTHPEDLHRIHPLRLMIIILIYLIILILILIKMIVLVALLCLIIIIILIILITMTVVIVVVVVC
jgi:hypothetical protein